MYPDPPYNGVTWTIPHHVGVIDATSLRALLEAAWRHADSADPAAEIARDMLAAGHFTQNVRKDSQQADTWRDYQQLLSMMGLVYSTTVIPHITLTPLAYAFLANTLSFEELVTLQSFKYQYPNGQNHLSAPARALLPLQLRDQTLYELQHNSGMRLRPACLIWKSLRWLEQRGANPSLSGSEIASYLFRCSTHDDVIAAATQIINGRASGVLLSPPGRPDVQRRHAQEWMRLLSLTPVFSIETNGALKIAFHQLSEAHVSAIDELVGEHSAPETFWPQTATMGHDPISWYSWFGSIDLVISDLGAFDGDEIDATLSSEIEQELAELDASIQRRSAPELRPLVVPPSGSPSFSRANRLIHSSYDGAITEKQRMAHESMVTAIAAHCIAKGAQVWHDPSSIDVLAVFPDEEFLFEVKSVSPKNLTHRLRLAVGQILQYDYFRDIQSDAQRRRVIGVVATVPDDAWYIPFLNDYLDIDLLSLNGDSLRVRSNAPSTLELFA